MPDTAPPPGNESTAAGAPAQAHLPLLVILFVGSGCAALIYEVVWFQMLQLVIGSTGVSLGVLLAAFMGGMCLGSMALPRYVAPTRHPLRVYAVLEALIGVLGLLLLLLIPMVTAAYAAVAPPGAVGIALRAIAAGLLLVPPTVLMGATLPAVARSVSPTARGVGWMGFFYGGNIAGAVLGCVLAGFYLLRLHDVVIASLVAAAINAGVAALAYAMARFAPAAAGAAAAAESAPPADGLPAAGRARDADGTRRLVLISIGLSGLVALGAQVVWTRLMAMLLGATTYTFSIILAVFLAALGIGSALGSYVARHTDRPRTALALCQAGAVLGVAWTACAIGYQLPFWPVNPLIATEAATVMQLDVARALWALAPAPLFWGASFPLAVAAAADRTEDPGSLVGRIYAANTVGAIAGALVFGVLVIPALGTQNAQRLLVSCGALSVALLMLPAMRDAARPLTARAGWGLGALGVAIWLVVIVAPLPAALVAHGRFAAVHPLQTVLYVGEGRNSSVAVTEFTPEAASESEPEPPVRYLHIGGKVVASTEPQDMRLQRMLGHLTALIHEQPRSVLVVGFGAGVTASTFVTHPGIERIVIAEIEPLVVRDSARFFERVNHALLQDPRVEVVFDDARHYLLTTDERFDLITSDPIHPWMKGAAALYTEEYFALLRRHLNPGGVVTQWVPLYESSRDAVQSEMATFFRVFPKGTVWGNTHKWRGHETVLAARPDTGPIDLDALAARLAREDYRKVVADLADTGYREPMHLFASYLACGEHLQDWLAGAELNRDQSLRLMFLAGLGLNRSEAGAIYAELLRQESDPAAALTGSPERIETIRRRTLNWR